MVNLKSVIDISLGHRLFTNKWIYSKCYVFLLQNYTPGNPATVLYIKNLAKDVTHDDFFYVFGEAVKT